MEDKRQQEVIYGKEQQVLNNMRRLNTIIESAYAPADTNSLWIVNGTLRYFRNGQWSGVGSTTKWEDIEDAPKFATVATSGSYNDLKDTPTIPTAYKLPNAGTSTRGGVLMAASVANLEGTEDTAAICTKVNDLLASLRAAGMLNS